MHLSLNRLLPDNEDNPTKRLANYFFIFFNHKVPQRVFTKAHKENHSNQNNQKNHSSDKKIIYNL